MQDKSVIVSDVQLSLYQVKAGMGWHQGTCATQGEPGRDISLRSLHLEAEATVSLQSLLMFVD